MASTAFVQVTFRVIIEGMPVVSWRPFLILTALLTLAAGCAESITAPSGSAPFTQIDVTPGIGTTAINGSVITVHYTGWLFENSKPEKKGTQFETSLGTDPFVFTLGSGSVIDGWDRGLVGMREGGVRRLIIPPSLAYGGFRNGVIPPNATLVFEVTLLNVAD
jgi:FKBP-type peptidyl-prolyl cis-trans isomerase FkpA